MLLDYSRRHLLLTRKMKELIMKLLSNVNMNQSGLVLLKMLSLMQKYLIGIEY
nr:MAG TPA: hypothetical protein [Caudoviricetes sp.]